tara:strand:+ start:124 stop:579 length:456 start_codon:yes stop_codon:yes gene_type:complete
MLSADLGESRPPFASTPPRFVSAFRIVVVALVLLDARCVRLVLAPSIVSSLPMLSIYSDWNFYYWTKKNDPPPKRRSVSFPQKIDTKNTEKRTRVETTSMVCLPQYKWWREDQTTTQAALKLIEKKKSLFELKMKRKRRQKNQQFKKIELH